MDEMINQHLSHILIYIYGNDDIYINYVKHDINFSDDLFHFNIYVDL